MCECGLTAEAALIGSFAGSFSAAACEGACEGAWCVMQSHSRGAVHQGDFECVLVQTNAARDSAQHCVSAAAGSVHGRLCLYDAVHCGSLVEGLGRICVGAGRIYHHLSTYDPTTL